jgi:hypothetical protein
MFNTLQLPASHLQDATKEQRIAVADRHAILNRKRDEMTPEALYEHAVTLLARKDYSHGEMRRVLHTMTDDG